MTKIGRLVIEAPPPPPPPSESKVVAEASAHLSMSTARSPSPSAAVFSCRDVGLSKATSYGLALGNQGCGGAGG